MWIFFIFSFEYEMSKVPKISGTMHCKAIFFSLSLSFWFIFPHTLASKKKQKPFKSRKQLRSQVCSGIHLVVWWNKHTLSQKYLPLKKSNRSTAVYCAVLLPCVETDGTNKDKHNTCISVVVFTVAQDFNSDQGLLMVKC